MGCALPSPPLSDRNDRAYYKNLNEEDIGEYMGGPVILVIRIV